MLLKYTLYSWHNQVSMLLRKDWHIPILFLRHRQVSTLLYIMWQMSALIIRHSHASIHVDIYRLTYLFYSWGIAIRPNAYVRSIHKAYPNVHIVIYGMTYVCSIHEAYMNSQTSTFVMHKLNYVCSIHDE